uniref:Sodium calcium exchanger 3 isoform 3 n=1 Tax=Tetraselmis sp. GSL018 TaxID=582737 RepID=A0A061RZ87_9CHLO|mmetsp:Transcript_5079/g.12378  ORF Transcript_5079/g.12378 Transcript_5079/m.12378 type:complete len:653 (+) Transcript_5079:1051-3009(+)
MRLLGGQEAMGSASLGRRGRGDRRPAAGRPKGGESQRGLRRNQPFRGEAPAGKPGAGRCLLLLQRRGTGLGSGQNRARRCPEWCAALLCAFFLTDVGTQRRESADGGAQKHSRAHYRLNAGHAMTGQSHLKRVQISPDAQPADGIKQRHLSLGDSPSFVLPASFNGLREPDAPEVGFKSIKYAVLESCGQVELTVTRLGNHANFSKECRIEYKTVEGTAKPESDYVHTQGTLILKPNQTEAKISVEIVDDDINETDEEFYVELFDPKQCMVRKNVSRATVVIIDDDNPGMLMFSQHEYKYGPAQTQVTMNVKRVKGADGAITCVYETVNGSAEADIHYEHTKGTLSFEHGETQKSITVNLLRKEEFKNGDVFHVQLSEVTGGAQLIRNGMTDVVSDETAPVDRGPSRMLRALTRGRTFEFQFGASTWGQQIRDSLSAGGATDIFGVQEEPSMADLLLHFVSAGWKLLFALIVPPASYGGGKPTFVVAILAIAGLTYVVGEFASLFGCIVGVPDMVTAISFVALGTSLPDTFASRLATLEADDADAAIGNVTGSNSVNVFLGLGLPWLLGSVYSYLKDEHYHSPAGSLVFSVIVYSVMAVACIALLMARRVFVGGELGGKGAGPAAMACCSMWVIYLVVSGLQATGKVDDPFT